MARLIMLLFAGLTLTAAALTYYNVGLEDTNIDNPSVRSGSNSGFFTSGGSYRPGK